MKILRLGNVIFVLMTTYFCVDSAPARPLNERSTKYTWVILDEQESAALPRRKITPKSIFILPPFGAESCSAGYTHDENGRCVKVVKLDTSAHEQFILQQFLNLLFGEDYDKDYDEEGEVTNVDNVPLPTSGSPSQFNIALT